MVLPKRQSTFPEDPGRSERANGHGQASSLVRPGGKVVTVTGAASFLGTNLVGLLEEDEGVSRIVAVDMQSAVGMAEAA